MSISVVRYTIVMAAAVVICLLLPSAGNHALAQGDLLISPIRVVLEGSRKTQEISLANVGADTATYAISIKNYRMKEDGGFDEIDTPDAGQHFAAEYFRFFPRRVTLAPKESQVVKVQVKNSGDMQPGEYRSHLYFRAVPDERLQGDTAIKKKDSSLSISLKPIFGITTPVIIRVGEYDGDVMMKDVAMDTSGGSHMLRMTFVRSGSMSVYGSLRVDYIKSDGAEPVEAKIVKGLGVYTPGLVRRFAVDLEENTANINFHKGRLHVVYKMQLPDKTEKIVDGFVELN